MIGHKTISLEAVIDSVLNIENPHPIGLLYILNILCHLNLSQITVKQIVFSKGILF